MRYSYYPGCSLEGTAREYDISTRSLFQALNVELTDVPDWTCCGATAAAAVSRPLALALPARNLALLEKDDVAADLLVPCSACYLNLKSAEKAVRDDPAARSEINQILAEVNLNYQGKNRVRHLLDVLSRDVGAETLKTLVTRSLQGFAVAPYYGCQCLRPYIEFDDPEEPTSMEPLIRATGAEVFPWSMGGRCCGASHMTTKPEVGLELVGQILESARGADAIVTVCPMCQMNLEAHQGKISKLKNRDLKITVLYLPQLLGLALGLSPEAVRLDLNLSVRKDFRVRAA